MRVPRNICGTSLSFSFAKQSDSIDVCDIFKARATIPSDVELCDIERYEVDDKGELKLVIPRHVDIVLPLIIDDANRLAFELRDLIPLSKARKKAYRKRLPLHTW